MVTLAIKEQTARQLEQIARNHATSVDEIAEQAIRSYIRLEAKQILTREAKAFAAMHKDLVQQHLGHYVAIRHGVLVDFDENQLDLILRVEDRFPDEVVLIRQVNFEPEKVYTIRSPRIVRE
jgi:predicted transcriptional regulator